MAKKKKENLYDIDCHSKQDGYGSVNIDTVLTFIKKCNGADSPMLQRFAVAIDSLSEVGDKLEIEDFTIELVVKAKE